MTFLVILKRFEVWLLLAIVAALVAFAFQPAPSPEDPAAPTGATVAAAAAVDPDKPTTEDPGALPEKTPLLALDGVKMVPSGGGWIVETTLAGKSPTGSDLVLDESAVTAANDRGEPVAREELLAEVWGYNAGVTAHTLETHIYRLRQKIEPGKGAARLLITDGGGYRLQA